MKTALITLLSLSLVMLNAGAPVDHVTLCGAEGKPVPVPEAPAKPKRPPPHQCQPYAEVCTACKDCSACNHCSVKKGWCSVCFKK